jgi:uncharacterized protein
MAHGEYSHIEIPYDDQSRVKRFYEGVFGWQLGEMDGFPGYLVYRAGPGNLGGGIGKRGESAGTTIRNYITVDSIDDAVKKVEQLGGTITTPKAAIGDMGWYAAGTDSEGNELALFETKVS